MGEPWRLNYLNARGAVQPAYSISLLTDLADMHFSFAYLSRSFDESHLNKKVEYIHGAINFTRDFYSQFTDIPDVFPIDFFMSYEPLSITRGWASARPDLARVTLQGLGTYMSSTSWLLVVHELSHIFTGANVFVPFDEGLADFLNFQFNTGYALNYELIADDYNQNMLMEQIFRDHFEPLNLWGHSASVLVSADEIHLFAYTYLKHNTHFELRGFAGRFADPLAPYYIPEINTYELALSFVLYLVDTYGIDHYMQVHWDNDNFDNVFGKPLEDAIQEWREFLNALSLESYSWETSVPISEYFDDMSELFASLQNFRKNIVSN